MELLYKINDQLAKIYKLGKLQVFLYPAILLGILACPIVAISALQYIAKNWDSLIKLIGL